MYKSFQRWFKIEYAFVSNKSLKPKDTVPAALRPAPWSQDLSLGFELSHICAFAPLGKLLQFVSYFMWLRYLGFWFPLLFVRAQFPPWVIIGKRVSTEEPAELQLFAAHLHTIGIRIWKCSHIHGSRLKWLTFGLSAISRVLSAIQIRYTLRGVMCSQLKKLVKFRNDNESS